MNWIRILLGALLLALLPACGGGGSASAPTATPVAEVSSVAKALSGPVTDKGTTLDNRKRTLAASTGSFRFAPDPTLDWAEATWPGLFPKGPQSSQLTHEGVTYTHVRVYNTGNILGITAAGDIRGYGPFTQNVLTAFGNTADYTCQIAPSACASATRPGTYRVDTATHTLLPNYTNGKMTWLGATDGKSYEVAPADVAFIRFNSNRRGWGAISQASTAPQADGSLVVTGICNNDRGLPTIITKDGKELWPDLSDQGYQLAGEGSPRMVLGMIEYGGYQPARTYLVREADNSLTLVMDFASNCAFGFGKDNVLVPLDVTKPLMFMWHSDKAGAGRQPGWGLGTRYPSVHQAYFDATEAEKGHLVVKFPNMACGDRGSITAYFAKTISADGKTVVYEPGVDGFGAAWQVVPKKDDANPIWEPGSNVTFDGDKTQITWDVALCKQ